MYRPHKLYSLVELLSLNYFQHNQFQMAKKGEDKNHAIQPQNSKSEYQFRVLYCNRSKFKM